MTTIKKRIGRKTTQHTKSSQGNGNSKSYPVSNYLTITLNVNVYSNM